MQVQVRSRAIVQENSPSEIAEWGQWLHKPVRFYCDRGKLWLCPAEVDTSSSSFPWIYAEQLKNLQRFDAEAGSEPDDEPDAEDALDQNNRRPL